ncbi:MAG: hypothetical protein WCQ89_02815, partial [Verrucomicrobiota bacterium]
TTAFSGLDAGSRSPASLPFGNQVIIPRANIASMRSRGQSIMPELEGGLTPQDLADLLEYITTASP